MHIIIHGTRRSVKDTEPFTLKQEGDEKELPRGTSPSEMERQAKALAKKNGSTVTVYQGQTKVGTYRAGDAAGEVDWRSFNTGLQINAIAKLRDAKLSANPTSADIAKAREMLQRAKSDIDGLAVMLR